jgi:ribosomal protein L30E
MEGTKCLTSNSYDMKQKIKRLAIVTGVVMLAMSSPAPVILSISQQGTNTFIIKAKNVPAETSEKLQMSTDLTTTNWIDLETNASIVGSTLTYTNIPATNACEFFRTVHPSITP